MNLSPNSIVINERQRIDIGDIDDLCDSLTRLGQLQAILVERVDNTYHLIDGFRRLTAVKKLNWPKIECIEKANLTPLQRQEMELEADTKRKDRTWQERALSYLALHELKGFGNPAWNVAKLADTLGRSIGHVSETLNIARALRSSKKQTTDWEKGLWSCVTIFDATKYLAMKCEDAFYGEILRRKQLINENLGLAEPVSYNPGNVQNVNQTPEEKINIPLRKFHLYNRVPEKDECSAMIMFWDKIGDIKKALSYLASGGRCILWLSNKQVPDFYKISTNITNLGYNVLPFPLIWNTVLGQQFPGSPFQLSYRMGLFITREGYISPFVTPRQAVFSEYAPPTMNKPLPKATLNMLDLISVENDKIWLPFGGPVVDIYRFNRIPIYQMEDDETLKTELKNQFFNVEFI